MTIDADIAGIVEFLSLHGGTHKYKNARNPTTSEPFPWILVQNIKSEELRDWYEEVKPERDLREMAVHDPEKHAAILASKNALHAAQEKMRALAESKDLIGDQAERGKYINQLFAPTQSYEDFRTQSLSDFRPENYPDRDALLHDVTPLLSYALFRHDQTGDYLLTMHDKRSAIYKKSLKMETLVDHQVIPASNLNEEEIFEEARWAAIKHLTHWLRFSPILERKNVEAMYEAERVKQLWQTAEHEVTRPLRSLFEFFPAFRRAYSGVDGFFHALIDVYGPQGNERHCQTSDVVHSDWGGYRSGADIAARYEVDSSHFVRLYEQMGNADRQDFAAAIDKFITQELPNVGAGIEDKHDSSSFRRSVSGQLAHIKLVIDHGSGVMGTVNEGDMLLSLADEFEAIANNEVKSRRSRFHRPYAEQKPIF